MRRRTCRIRYVMCPKVKLPSQSILGTLALSNRPSKLLSTSGCKNGHHGAVPFWDWLISRYLSDTVTEVECVARPYGRTTTHFRHLLSILDTQCPSDFTSIRLLTESTELIA